MVDPAPSSQSSLCVGTTCKNAEREELEELSKQLGGTVAGTAVAKEGTALRKVEPSP